MTEYLLLGIAGIVVIGITAQWLSWRLRLPSILLLLLFGFVAGPVAGFLNPDELFGDLLFPVVSISVALILFEGGLSLKLGELRQTGHIVRNLITIGALVTWILSAAAAYWVLEFELPIALLLGAVLVVTGPTVIIPLLRHVQAKKNVGSIIKWEGIMNDPIGAILAVLVFEAILVSGVAESATIVFISLVETILIGSILGGAGAGILIFLFKRYWVPGYLQNSVALMMVIGAFAVSNLLQDEAGLLTVTLMGVILANQKMVSVRHIVEFKENLGIVLLSGLFIILAARLQLTDLTHLGLKSFAFLAILILIVRPVSVMLSTIKTGLNWREKFFLAWMAPRGIVAAAVTAIFAIELAEKTGYTQAEFMVPEIFFVIVGTVAIYGLSAAPLGHWLDVAQPNPQGAIIVGAHEWARSIAGALHSEGLPVLLVDSSRSNITAARLEGLPTVYASALSGYILDELELAGIGRMIALTPSDELNSLATLHFEEVFDQSEVYQLAPKEPQQNHKETVSLPLRGRLLFGDDITYAKMDDFFKAGAVVKKTRLSEKFDYNAFQKHHNGTSVPLFLITSAGELMVWTADNALKPQVDDTIISLTKSAELVT